MNILYRNPFSASDILFWIEIPLWSFPQDKWWQIAAATHRTSEILSPINQIVPRDSCESTYIFPVIKTWDYPRRLKIIQPNRLIFTYQQRKITGWVDHHDYAFHWVVFHAKMRQQADPTPCPRCGWYCQQTCQTWKV